MVTVLLLLGLTQLILGCNSGKWIDREEKEHSMGTGTGLANVRKRLANAYHENHIFEIDKKEQRVCIKIGMKTNGNSKI